MSITIEIDVDFDTRCITISGVGGKLATVRQDGEGGWTSSHDPTCGYETPGTAIGDALDALVMEEWV